MLDTLKPNVCLYLYISTLVMCVGNKYNVLFIYKTLEIFPGEKVESLRSSFLAFFNPI